MRGRFSGIDWRFVMEVMAAGAILLGVTWIAAGDEILVSQEVRARVITRFPTTVSSSGWSIDGPGIQEIEIVERLGKPTTSYIDGDDPPPNTGLAQAAADEARAIGDGNGPRASIAFRVVSPKIADGTLGPDDVPQAIRATLGVVLNENRSQWEAAAERLLARLNTYAGNDRQKFAAGCLQVADGLKSVSGNALPTKAEVLVAAFQMQANPAYAEKAGWLDFFQFFISELLPLILDLLERFG